MNCPASTAARTPPPYLGLDEITEFVPFTAEAIRKLMQRGVLVERLHYFRHGRRLIFKWEAVVAWIEQRDAETERIPMLNGGLAE